MVQIRKHDNSLSEENIWGWMEGKLNIVILAAMSQNGA